jgi:hypothetical protein
MKHLKTFENIEASELKTYIAWDMKFAIFVLKIIEVKENNIQMEKLYEYDRDIDTLKAATSLSIMNFTPGIVKKYAIYSSDSLEELKRKLPEL